MVTAAKQKHIQTLETQAEDSMAGVTDVPPDGSTRMKETKPIDMDPRTNEGTSKAPNMLEEGGQAEEARARARDPVRVPIEILGGPRQALYPKAEGSLLRILLKLRAIMELGIGLELGPENPIDRGTRYGGVSQDLRGKAVLTLVNPGSTS